MEPGLATSATNRKHKREVCRYWLQNRCRKGQGCEFLHAMMPDRMPLCPMGDLCQTRLECPYQHLDDTRPVCANYQVGFCSFGKRCRHRHVALGLESLPEVSAYWTPEYAANDYAKHMAPAHTWRSAPCEYFKANGWCPYFDMCNFSHELRRSDVEPDMK